MPFLETPYFASQAQFDSFQLEFDLGGEVPKYPPGQMFAGQLQAQSLSVMQGLPTASQQNSGVFSTVCFLHCTTDGPDFWTVTANGVSLESALAQWYFNGLASRRVIDDSCSGWPCHLQCAPEELPAVGGASGDGGTTAIQAAPSGGSPQQQQQEQQQEQQEQQQQQQQQQAQQQHAQAPEVAAAPSSEGGRDNGGHQWQFYLAQNQAEAAQATGPPPAGGAGGAGYRAGLGQGLMATGGAGAGAGGTTPTWSAAGGGGSYRPAPQSVSVSEPSLTGDQQAALQSMIATQGTGSSPGGRRLLGGWAR